jgi:5-methylcytosine-specific restriction endonuclease McrA
MPEYKTEEQKKKFYRSSDWEALRLQALERDNFECQHCKKDGRVTIDSIKKGDERKEIVLNVHHKYEIEMFPRLALHIDNLETLCLYHHNKIHGKLDELRKYQFKRKKTKWNDEKW